MYVIYIFNAEEQTGYGEEDLLNAYFYKIYEHEEKALKAFNKIGSLEDIKPFLYYDKIRKPEIGAVMLVRCELEEKQIIPVEILKKRSL